MNNSQEYINIAIIDLPFLELFNQTWYTVIY